MSEAEQALGQGINAAPAEESDLPLAAVDLGSNSFQLLVATFSHGQLKVIDRLRESVRLAAGLDEHQNLSLRSQQRALECLARFGERLRDIPPERLRVVGTNTLRKAKNPSAFIEEAQELLGHEIDIISGIEEARLIYVGVSRSLPAVDGKQLIIDIGGGSTELAQGRGYQPEALESLYMGCVGMSREYFRGGRITAKRFQKARTAVSLELRPVAKRFKGIRWKRVAGASGTIRAAAVVLMEMGLTHRNITVPGLERLIADMISQGHVDNLDLPGLSEDRAAVFPGGIAILVETMRELNIREIAVTDGALREGIIYDLVGRLSEQDARERTVHAMEKRYHVDQDQADRVELTAVALLDQVAEPWKLDLPVVRKMLAWSARLHEVGLDIAHAHYHRHGAYLLEHADMPGFHTNEQRLLASIVGSHRRKLSPEFIADTAPKGWAKRAMRLSILLRLAVLFNRCRTYEFPDALKIGVDKRVITLSLTESWLQNNPLTLADLEQEQAYLRTSGYQLELHTVPDGTPA